jgi:D-glycero-D-manno-heptose 1,7-bisphosphate phosphatase
MVRAALLDRDGVINVDRGYVYRWDEFAFVAGATGAMRSLAAAGYALVIVTNQSGIARGYYTEADYRALTDCMTDHLRDAGIELAGIYHCPHGPVASGAGSDCNCRKPAPGLLLRARDELDLDLAHSFLVGDKMSDIEAARAAGVGRAYLVGHPRIGQPAAAADAIFSDLAACAAHVLALPAQPGVRR